MRNLMVFAFAAGLAITSCSSSGTAEDGVSTSRLAPTPGQAVLPVVASSEIVVGDNRLQIGLIDTTMLRFDPPRRHCKSTSSLPGIRSRHPDPRCRSCGPSSRFKVSG